jgi:hypothetical protein
MPSIDGLWDTFSAVKQMQPLMRYDQQLRWRIVAADWDFLLSRRDPRHPPFARRSIEGKDYLFDVPVDIVQPGRFGSPYRWPELVIICDRRN